MICRRFLEITEGAFTAGLFHRHDGVKEKLSVPFMTIPRIEVCVDLEQTQWARRSRGVSRKICHQQFVADYQSSLNSRLSLCRNKTLDEWLRGRSGLGCWLDSARIWLGYSGKNGGCTLLLRILCRNCLDPMTGGMYVYEI